MTVQTVEAEVRSFAAERGESAEHGAVLFVPLDRLKPSPRNVRKTPHAADDIEALAASIAAKRGQQPTQPLIVEPEIGRDAAPTGCFLVTAGEGRRLGLRLLAKRKVIRKTHAVRCLLDGVNHHWGAVAGAAALSTLLGVGVQLGADTTDSSIVGALRFGAAGSLNQAGQQIVGRALTIPPTLTIRPGSPVQILVNRDLVLEPYSA